MSNEPSETGEIRCKIEILTNDTANVFDAKGNLLEILSPSQVKELVVGKTITKVEITPFSTYLETNSGVVCINGIWLRYLC